MQRSCTAQMADEGMLCAPCVEYAGQGSDWETARVQSGCGNPLAAICVKDSYCSSTGIKRGAFSSLPDKQDGRLNCPSSQAKSRQCYLRDQLL